MIYISGLTHATGVTGEAILTGDTFKANLASGRIGPLVAKNAVALIPTLHKVGTVGQFSVHVEGAMPDVMALIDMKPLNYPTKFGIDPKSVEIVKAGPPEFPALLARGDVDGYFLWEPWPTNGIKQGGRILLTSGDVGYAYNMWLSANGAWLATHQAEAKSILAALAEACAIVRADPAKGAAAVQAEAKIPLATALDTLKEVQCTVRDFTAADMATYDKIADFLAARKITPGKVDLGKIIQQGFYVPK